MEMWKFLIFLSLVSRALCLFNNLHCVGNTGVIVHLFEWKWKDIEKECTYLAQAGYCAVQTSVVTENKFEVSRPWWERYQPVSYKIVTRSGSEDEFSSMVSTCNSLGVRIINDVVLNHMARGGVGLGVAGSFFNGTSLFYPAVPYNSSHFHSVNDCNDPSNQVSNISTSDDLRQCQLLSLPDLDQSQSYVRSKIINLLDRLVDHGSVGFRVDAAKHIHPQDLAYIYKNVKNVTMGGSPVFINEVVNTVPDAVTSDEYFDLGLVTEFRYSEMIGDALTNADYSQLCHVFQTLLKEENALLFIDNHDTQRGRERPGSIILTYKTPPVYKRAQAFTLAAGYGTQRIMSSYYFQDTEAGPPADSNDHILDVVDRVDGSCGQGWICEHRWHVIKQMVQYSNMVRTQPMHGCQATTYTVSFMRGNDTLFWMTNKDTVIQETVVTNLTDGIYCDLMTGCQMKYLVHDSGSVTFTSAEDGIIVLVPDNSSEDLNSSLPVTTALTTDYLLTTDSLTTTDQFITNGTIGLTSDYPLTTQNFNSTDQPLANWTSGLTTDNLVITDNMNITDQPMTNTTSEPSVNEVSTTSAPDWRRTVIFVQKQTNPGQDVFLRGGVDDSRIQGTKACENKDLEHNPCAIPIKHRPLSIREPTPARDAWSKGDDYLDWYGPEPGQGTNGAQAAQGTPGQWTSSNPGGKYYDTLNNYGDHYWIVDVDMDCSRTFRGFFEFRGVLSNGWEMGSSLDIDCTGDGATPFPYHAGNHIGRCGYINVYHWGSGLCEIHSFSGTSGSQDNVIG